MGFRKSSLSNATSSQSEAPLGASKTQRIKMKLLIALLFFVAFTRCAIDAGSWGAQWAKHEESFEQIVNLLKENKLQKVYGRGGYEIPDSFQLKSVCGQIAFRETEFTYDGSFSVLFRLGFDKDKPARTYRTIVYTDNEKRISEYNSKAEDVTKIKENWYYLSRP